MHEHEAPITETVTASAARSRWSGLLSRVYRGDARVLVEKGGVPVAALVAPDDLARLTRLEAEREARFAVIDRIRDAFKDVSDEELEREIPVEVEQARAQLRAEREQAARPA